MLRLLEGLVALALVVLAGSVLVLRAGGFPDGLTDAAGAVVRVTRLDRVPGVLPDESAEADASESQGGRSGGRPDGRPGGGRFGGRGGGPTLVTAQAVEIAPVVQQIRAIGTGEAARSVTVTTPVAGVVETVSFTSGDRVAEGAPLVTLERESQAIDLERAQAENEAARRRLERFESLGGTVSAAQLDEVRTEVAVSDAALHDAEFEHGRRVIRAPFTGRVGLNDIAVGQFLTAGAPLVSLDDASALRVEFLVPEDRAAFLTVGETAEVATPALPGRALRGTVTALDSRVDADTRTLRARLELPNPDGALKPGMTFAVSVRQDDGERLPVVPALAVQWGRDGASVWRVGAPGEGGGRAVERVAVDLRKREGDVVFVQGDLSPDDRVVVEGAQKLNPRSTVRLEGDAPAEANRERGERRRERGEGGRPASGGAGRTP